VGRSAASGAEFFPTETLTDLTSLHSAQNVNLSAAYTSRGGAAALVSTDSLTPVRPQSGCYIAISLRAFRQA
jgi:hypothetical protein